MTLDPEALQQLVGHTPDHSQAQAESFREGTCHHKVEQKIEDFLGLDLLEGRFDEVFANRPVGLPASGERWALTFASAPRPLITRLASRDAR